LKGSRLSGALAKGLQKSRVGAQQWATLFRYRDQRIRQAAAKAFRQASFFFARRSKRERGKIMMKDAIRRIGNIRWGCAAMLLGLPLPLVILDVDRTGENS
jgi:hypothetical protein